MKRITWDARQIFPRRSPGQLLIAACVLAGLQAQSRQVQATSATWLASPTDGNWVTTGGETNWSMGAAAFPGSTTVLTSTDTATFAASSQAAITINGGTLDIGSIVFDGAAPAYTIGSNAGNSLDLTNAGNVILGASATSFTGTGIAETIAAPLVLEPASTASAGAYTFRNNSTTATDTLNFTGAICGGATSSSITLTLNGANTGANTISGAISNGSAGSLSLVIGGYWTLAGSNTFNGGVLINSGTLAINNANALGTGTLSLTNGRTTLDNTSGAPVAVSTSNTITSPGSLIFLGSNALDLGNGPVSLNTHPTITVNASTLTIGGTITGPATGDDLSKSGAGTLVISGAIQYLGATGAGAGTLVLSGDNSAASGGVIVATSAALDINSATALGTGTLVLAATSTIDNTSGASITETTVAPQTWNGSFTYAGSSNLNLGAGAVTLGAAPTITVAANTLTVGGAIGTGSANGFTKAGGGTLTLTGTSTYTGTTSVSAGTLIVDGSTGASVMTIGNTVAGFTPTLAGIGAIGGAVSITNSTTGSAGHVDPGDNGIGTLKISSLNLKNAGVVLDWDFGAAGSSHTSIGSADLIAVTSNTSGSLAFPSAATVVLNLLSGSTNFNGSGSYELFSYVNATAVTRFTGGTVTGNGTAGSFVFNNFPVSDTYTVVNDTTNDGIYLDFTASVPEPASMSGLTVGVLTLLVRRRRKASASWLRPAA